ncbi:hypothetical protein AMELA_G00268430 [Ameiurus melas]|uniref:Uncharacterized protein n=1 Tax=Ameiurus melas TaxID=219545 RepID=A0A7J5ZN96_AMEME|nr:hypothetical protein AMELA_G00268430 [Ameiurus melas]
MRGPAPRAPDCGGPCRGLRENAVRGGGSAGQLLYNLHGRSHAKAVVHWRDTKRGLELSQQGDQPTQLKSSGRSTAACVPYTLHSLSAAKHNPLRAGHCALRSVLKSFFLSCSP